MYSTRSAGAGTVGISQEILAVIMALDHYLQGVWRA